MEIIGNGWKGLSCIYMIGWISCVSCQNTVMDKDSQKRFLKKKKFECIGLFLTDKPHNNSEGPFCSRTWDDIMCWPSTSAGTVAIQPCPDYVSGFNVKENATRMCMPNGSWYVNPTKNTTWTNFSACVAPVEGSSVPDSVAKHLRDMRVMYNIGYGLSLASLLTAVVIMLYFKKLHCPRNTIHLNLFVSFILRAAASFIRENLIIDGVGFSIDINISPEGKVIFKQDVSHWECRMFFTLFMYIIAANYMWIFVEALYLQMLISVSVFTEKNRLKWYMILGWTFPLTFVLPWAIVRATIDNEYCWNTYYDMPGLMWIVYGPITASIIINFSIFINIVRVLFTKLNASPCPETKKFRYRRLAKSTLILIPLFGVYYIIFTVGTLRTEFTGDAEVVTLYAEMFFNSYQGFILSLLFCFFNAEVQAEFKKAWKRHTIQRGGSGKTKLSFMSRTRCGRIGHHLDTVNGSVKFTDRVRPYEMTSSPSSIDEKLPFTSISVEQKVNQNCDDVSKEETTPCLNNNHMSECNQTDNDSDDCPR